MCSQPLKKSTTSSISASKAGHSNYQLTPQQIHQFHAEGFLIIRNFLTQDEIEPLIQVCNADPTISGTNSFMDFCQGLPCRISFWTDLDNSYLGLLPRLTRSEKIKQPKQTLRLAKRPPPLRFLCYPKRDSLPKSPNSRL